MMCVEQVKKIVVFRHKRCNVNLRQTYFSELLKTSHFPSGIFWVWQAFGCNFPLGGWNVPTSQLLVNAQLV